MKATPHVIFEENDGIPQKRPLEQQPPQQPKSETVSRHDPADIPIWGKAPTRSELNLKPDDARRKSGQISVLSQRESTSTFQSISDMGHQNWITSLAHHRASASIFGETQDSSEIDVDLSSVWVTLMNACVKPAIDYTGKQEFIPLGQLLRILSPKNVDKILNQRFAHGDLQHLVNEVYGAKGEPKRLKIMATLILIDGLQYLLEFVEAGVEDSHLPVTLWRRGHKAVLFDREKKEIEYSRQWKWSYREADYFSIKQMHLCSLFCTIDEDGQFMDHFRLPADFVLPFKDSEPPEVRYGGYGKVTKVFIEPSHLWYRDHPSEADSLARRLVIKKLADREHLHQLLFSFRRAEFYYLVFEWADGDLTDLWKLMPKLYRPNAYEDACWFFRQCVGIARSLGGLHSQSSSYTATTSMEELVHVELAGKYGRHSDIKPQNILWFSDYQGDKKDHLVISDLGLTQFNTTQSKSHAPWAGIKGYTQTYKAPESEVRGQVGLRYDIWSLGCVFLEHAIVFLMRDVTCVRGFSDSRLEEDRSRNRSGNYFSDTFYNVITDDPDTDTDPSITASRGRGEVKNAVARKIQELKAHHMCSASIFDFLDLIGEGMLVADQSKRHTADMVFKALNDIQLRCGRDSRYACLSIHLPPEEQAKPVPEAEVRGSQSQILAGISGGQDDPEVGMDISNARPELNTEVNEPKTIETHDESSYIRNGMAKRRRTNI
ncbi:serine threonine kinase [Fusarium beomiforme]|uniref:Serine threonine kinase n=1 Tax=Fusarium beomiforme TaxID=44412 RepID=A0A9P5AUN5_9HYPO|nr:serine threonine kinase [Fusarium beomiforme]